MVILIEFTLNVQVVTRMLIDKEKYKLKPSNYIQRESVKSKIVIGNTFSTDMKHFIGWEKRWFGSYTKTANFTIDIDGNIYEHFPPKFFSNFFNDIEIREEVISIVIENEGWLLKDLYKKNEHLNYVGDIYKREDAIFDKKWRKYRFWAPYNEKQLESASKLVKALCEDFSIPTKVIGHNTKVEGVYDYKGVLYKSNFEKFYTDVSPAWNFKEFKNKVEN